MVSQNGMEKVTKVFTAALVWSEAAKGANCRVVAWAKHVNVKW